MSCDNELSKLQAVQQSLDEVNQHIQLIFSSHTDLEQITSKLLPVEAAKLNVAMAYAMATLYYVQKKIDGENLHKHPIHEDLQRIKKYVQKVNTKDKELKAQSGESYSSSIESSNGKRSSNEQISEENKSAKKTKLKVDSKAASRMIKHNL